MRPTMKHSICFEGQKSSGWSDNEKKFHRYNIDGSIVCSGGSGKVAYVAHQME